MKKQLLILLSISCSIVFGQSTDAQSKLDNQQTFERPSINYLSVSFNNLRSSFDPNAIELNAAFDINEIDRKEIIVDYSYPDFLSATSDAESIKARKAAYKDSKEEREQAIIKALNDNKVGHEVLASILADAQGGFTTKKLEERGLNSKTDSDVLADQQSIDDLNLNAGISLLNKTYIALLGELKVESINTEDSEGYKSRGYYVVVRLDYSKVEPEVIGAISKKLEFKNALMKISEIPFEVVDEGEIMATSVQSPEQVFVPTGEILKDKIAKKLADKINESRRPLAELKAELPAQLYASHLFESQRAVDDFKPRAPVFSTDPIASKLGKKEGLTKGQRYAVKENVLGASGEVDTKHRGYVRAKNIVDNPGVATGNTEPSTFYQIQGKSVDPGMLMVWEDDYGISFRVLGHSKFNPSIDRSAWLGEVQVGYLIKPAGRSVKAGITIQFDQTFGDIFPSSPDAPGIYAGIFASKGFGIGRNAELEFSAAGLYATNDDVTTAWYTEGLGGEARASLNMNLGKSMQLNVAAGFRSMALSSDFYIDPSTLLNYVDFEATPTLGVGITYNM
jgi:hypothetical protein